MQAILNFVRPTAKVPQLDMGLGPAGSLPLDPRQVALTDAAAEDEDHHGSLRRRGFTAMPFPAGTAIDPAAQDWRERFTQEIGRALVNFLGARQVTVVAATVVQRRGDDGGHLRPVSVCHADYTAGSAARWVAQFSKTGEAALRERFAMYNIWWLASEPPQDRPLALCDPTTLAASDVIQGHSAAFDTHGQKREFGEFALFRYNPRQRWLWYPGLRSDRLLIMAGFDSDPEYASMVPHSAFDNPDAPADVATRVSIECRCCAVW